MHKNLLHDKPGARTVMQLEYSAAQFVMFTSLIVPVHWHVLPGHLSLLTERVHDERRHSSAATIIFISL
jgi:hypothetical protein